MSVSFLRVYFLILGKTS